MQFGGRRETKQLLSYCGVIFPFVRKHVKSTRKWKRDNVWKATRKRVSWAWFNFYVYAWPFKHCLYFIYAGKIYVRTHGKIARQQKEVAGDFVFTYRFRSPVLSDNPHIDILCSHGLIFPYCGRQEEPAIQISRLLLLMRRINVASIRLDFH